MKTYYSILSLVAVLVLSSCVSATIESRKAPDFNDKIQRLFLMTRGAKSSKDFYTTLKFALDNHLKKHDVKLGYYFFDPLSLDTDAQVQEKVDAFKPNLIMMVEQTETVKQRGGYNQWTNVNHVQKEGGVFDLKLFTPGSEAPVWRGSLETVADYAIEEAGWKSADKLYKKLIEDGLLPPLVDAK